MLPFQMAVHSCHATPWFPILCFMYKIESNTSNEDCFVKQEKFPFAEEKLQTLKGAEELGFQAMVNSFLRSVWNFISCCVL